MEYWREEAAGPDPGSFARTVDAARKYVVSSTLEHVDRNAELVRPEELEATVRRLKDEPGVGLYCGGVQLPLALADLGLIDEYEFVVHPRLIGHGPTLFGGLARPLDLELVGRQEFEGEWWPPATCRGPVPEAENSVLPADTELVAVRVGQDRPHQVETGRALLATDRRPQRGEAPHRVLAGLAVQVDVDAVRARPRLGDLL